MAVDHITLALQSLSGAVAVIDREDGHIVFENATFFKFFPGTGGDDETIFTRIEAINEGKMRRKLDRGRKYEVECDIQDDARTLNLKIGVRAVGEEDDELLLVETRDFTKQKEAEYMLDSYSRMSERASREMEREKERVEKLLLNIMPKSIYEELKDYGTTTPQKYENASVLMLDFVDFTEMAIARDPGALIAELNDIFSAFDRIVELFNCERIKTIGDAYMAVAGLPDANQEHAINMAQVALRMRRYLEKRNAAHPTQWRFRIGVASGALIGSIVGIQKYVYDVFGPAVNLASRLEAHCEPMKVTICDKTKQLLGSEFTTHELPTVEIKGFGEQQLHVLDAEEKRHH